MNHPEALYYIGLLLACPLILVNRTAGVLVAAGAGACLAYAVGLPMAWAYLAIHLACLAWAYRVCETAPCVMAGALFVPLIFIDGLEISGLYGPPASWWTRWSIVMAQLALLPLGVDWGHLRAKRRLLARHRSIDRTLRFAC